MCKYEFLEYFLEKYGMPFFSKLKKYAINNSKIQVRFFKPFANKHSFRKLDLLREKGLLYPIRPCCGGNRVIMPAAYNFQFINYMSKNGYLLAPIKKDAKLIKKPSEMSDQERIEYYNRYMKCDYCRECDPHEYDLVS